MVTDAILDTSILVDLLRGFPPAKDWFAGLGRRRVAVTPVVWMETVQGATDREKRAQAIRFLRQFHVEHPTEDDNRWAMRGVVPLSVEFRAGSGGRLRHYAAFSARSM